MEGYLRLPSIQKVVLNYQNNINKDDGYSKDTYVKIPASEWPIEE